MSGSDISWAICKSAHRSRQITMPAPHLSSFLEAGCPSCHPTNSVKALKALPGDRKSNGWNRPQECNRATFSPHISYQILHQNYHLVSVSFCKTVLHMDQSHARRRQIWPTVESLPCSQRQWRAVPRPAKSGIGHSWSTSTILQQPETVNAHHRTTSTATIILQPSYKTTAV